MSVARATVANAKIRLNQPSWKPSRILVPSVPFWQRKNIPWIYAPPMSITGPAYARGYGRVGLK